MKLFNPITMGGVFFNPLPPPYFFPITQKPQNLHFKIITNIFSDLQGQHQKVGLENPPTPSTCNL